MSPLPPVSHPLLYTTDPRGSARAAVQAADVVAGQQSGLPPPAQPGGGSPVDAGEHHGPPSDGALRILLEAQRSFLAAQLLPQDPATGIIQSGSVLQLL